MAGPGGCRRCLVAGDNRGFRVITLAAAFNWQVGSRGVAAAYGLCGDGGISGAIARRQVGSLHRRRGWETAGVGPPASWGCATTDHARWRRPPVATLVVRFIIADVFLSVQGTRRSGKSMGRPRPGRPEPPAGGQPWGW